MMKYYQCVLELNQDWLGDTGTIDSHSDAMDKAFRDTNINFTGTFGLPFHNFLAFNTDYAKRYITDKLPFFNEMEWTEKVLDDSIESINAIRHECTHQALKLRLYEYNTKDVVFSKRAKFFASMIAALDVYYDQWYEPSGIAGECTIRHTEINMRDK